MNNKSSKRKIREALGLPSDTFKIMGVVADDSVSENTMTSKCGVRMCEHPKNTSLGEVRLVGGSHAGSVASRNAEFGMRGALNGQFDCGASGGATSPNTEVNADHQGVIDETIGASGGATLPNTKKNPKSRTAHQELPDNNK